MTTITKAMSINDVLTIDRTAASVFLKYGMHCFGCPFAMGENIEQAAATHGVDADALVKDINEYLASKE